MSYERIIPNDMSSKKKIFLQVFAVVIFFTVVAITYCLFTKSVEDSYVSTTSPLPRYIETSPKNIRDFLYRFVEKYNAGISRKLIPVTDSSDLSSFDTDEYQE